MRDWRAEIYKQDLQSGIGVSNLADEMADEIDRLRDALAKRIAFIMAKDLQAEYEKICGEELQK